MIIHCGTNNFDNYKPYSITTGIMKVASTLLGKNLILPQDRCWSLRQRKLSGRNAFLQKEGEDTTNVCSMHQDDNWVRNDPTFHNNLFYRDHLH